MGGGFRDLLGLAAGWLSAPEETALDPPIYPRNVTHAKDGIAAITHAKENVTSQGAGCITTDK